jgi:hypothetical protein
LEIVRSGARDHPSCCRHTNYVELYGRLPSSLGLHRGDSGRDLSRRLLFGPHSRAVVDIRGTGGRVRYLLTMAGTVELVDPVPELLAADKITSDAALLATRGVLREGVAADGVAKLVIRLKTNTQTTTPVTFSLDPTDGATGTSGRSEEDGGLSTIDKQDSQATRVTVQSVATPRGQIAFAVYNAPLDFVRRLTADTRHRLRSIGVAVHVGEVRQNVNLKIARPPVFLVHGIWAGPSTWTNFAPLVQGGRPDSRFSVAYANYKVYRTRFLGQS